MLEYNGSTFNGWESGDLPDSEGKLKITRVGGAVTMHAWTGGVWVSVPTSYPNTEDMSVMLFAESKSTNYPSIVCDFDNFKVNTGTVKWP